MKKVLCSGAALVVIGLLLLQAQTSTSGHAKSQAAAQGENVIFRLISPKEPVEITSLKVGGSSVIFGVPFQGDENWADALHCEAKNTGDRIIADLRITLSFVADGAKPKRISIPLTSPGPIPPNETVRMIAPAASVASLREVLSRQGMAANFRRGVLRVQYAKFQHGSVWVQGVSLGAKDPRTGKRKPT